MILIGLIWIGIKIKITIRIKIHFPLDNKEILLIIKKDIILASKNHQQKIKIINSIIVIRIKIKNKVKLQDGEEITFNQGHHKSYQIKILKFFKIFSCLCQLLEVNKE